MNVEQLVQTVLSNEKSEDTYIGEDGLRYCSKCKEPIEDIITLGGKERKVSFMCKCKREAEAAELKREAEERINNARIQCFTDKTMRAWNFDSDDKSKPDITRIAKNYVEHFQEFRRQGQGLMFYGAVGTGKSFIAACIANSLIDKGYKVLMINLATLVQQYESLRFEERGEWLQSINRYTLLIIDDLGAERTTPYMQEKVFQVINSRYVSRLPLIVTTNLTRDEISTPNEPAVQRIYDRVIEMCYPVECNGESKRRDNFRKKYYELRSKLTGNRGSNEES